MNLRHLCRQWSTARCCRTFRSTLVYLLIAFADYTLRQRYQAAKKKINKNNKKRLVNTANAGARPPATAEDASLFYTNSLAVHIRRHSRAGDKLPNCVVAVVVVSGEL